MNCVRRVILLGCLVLLCLSAVCSAAGQKIAVVPYLNTTEEDKEYLPEFMDTYYTVAMEGFGLESVPTEEVNASLAKTGYDVSNQMLADKDMLAEVAKATGADYVVAVELSDLKVANHMSFFQIKKSITTKLKYNFYIAKTNRLNSFQVTGADENKAVIGGIGEKSPINNALKQATDKANEKIKGYIVSNNDVVIAQ